MKSCAAAFERSSAFPRVSCCEWHFCIQLLELTAGRVGSGKGGRTKDSCRSSEGPNHQRPVQRQAAAVRRRRGAKTDLPGETSICCERAAAAAAQRGGSGGGARNEAQAARSGGHPSPIFLPVPKSVTACRSCHPSPAVPASRLGGKPVGAAARPILTRD